MSQHVTVELNEREMEQVKAAVRAQRLDPQHMTAVQLVQALGKVAADANAALAIAEAASAPPLETTKPPLTAEQARAKRIEAVMSVHGMWKDKPDMPQDALEYQREVRAEWR